LQSVLYKISARWSGERRE